MHAYFVVLWDLAAFGLACIVAAAIVETIGLARIARWLRLDVTDDDQ